MCYLWLLNASFLVQDRVLADRPLLLFLFRLFLVPPRPPLYSLPECRRWGATGRPRRCHRGAEELERPPRPGPRWGVPVAPSPEAGLGSLVLWSLARVLPHPGPPALVSGEPLGGEMEKGMFRGSGIHGGDRSGGRKGGGEGPLYGRPSGISLSSSSTRSWP